MSVNKFLPKIAIIGAGPAGLTLASLLQRRSIASTIYDLRSKPSPDAIKIPSGSLDLHEGTGLLAIERCGLTSGFRSMTSDCSQEMRFSDRFGKVAYHLDGTRGDRPEISRNALTHLLLSSLPDGCVQWDAKVLSITPGSMKRWRLSFAEDRTHRDEEFDLIVGADGAWSRVRNVIPGASKPTYSGISNLTFTITDFSTRYPALSAMVGTGSFAALGAQRSVITQRGVMDSLRIYLSLSIPSPTYFTDSGFYDLSSSELETLLLTDDEIFFASFGPTVKDLISAACDAEKDNKIDARALFQMPRQQNWTHTAGLTLIGDAAHLTIPAGEGVNIAMHDAFLLSEAIASSSGGESEMESQIRAFEEDMWIRGEKNAADADDLRVWMYDDVNAPEKVVAMFTAFEEQAKMVVTEE